VDAQWAHTWGLSARCAYGRRGATHWWQDVRLWYPAFACYQDISKSYWQIWTELCASIDLWSRTNQLDFGTDLNQHPARIFRLLQHGEITFSDVKYDYQQEGWLSPTECVSVSAHFSLPWDNRGKCYTVGKRIQCLSNASQHVPIYLQPFPSNSIRSFKSSSF